MAYYDTTWYCNSTGYAAVTARPQNTAVAAGVLRRQFTAPAVGSERVFVCIVAGTTANVTDATWVTSRGAKTTDGTATWQECTGMAAVNGDLTNTLTWTQAKAIANPSQGAIIKRNNGASFQIASTGGSLGASEPAFSDTAGVTTTESTTTWTSLGPVANFTGGQAPHARLINATAANWFVAGNTIYLGSNHAESQATAMTIAPSGGAATNVTKILCGDGYPPTTVTTGATISTTGAVNINFTGNTSTFYIYGITFVSGVGQTSGSISLTPTTAFLCCDNCSFKVAATGTSGKIQVSGSSSANANIWNNCTISFGNVAQYLDVGTGLFTWQNTGAVLVGGSSVPTGLVGVNTTSGASNITFEALDLSQLTGNLLGGSAAYQMGTLLVKDCKLNAAMAVATPTAFGQTVQLVRSSA